MRSRAGAALCSLFLATSLLVSAAKAEPPELPVPADLVGKLTVNKVLVNSVQAGGLMIGLEKTRLSDLRKLYPAMPVHHHGDAGNSESWGCVMVSSPVGDVRVWPSSGELQGGDVIDSVMLQRADGPPTADCPRLAAASVAPGLDDGVAISTVRADVISRLGTPGSAVGGVLYYGYSTRPGLVGKHGCATSGAVAAGFLARRVDRIWVSRETSC